VVPPQTDRGEIGLLMAGSAAEAAG
jgi:hypothetical protein